MHSSLWWIVDRWPIAAWRPITTLIASKAELMSLAQDGESATAELMHWQRDLLGLKG